MTNLCADFFAAQICLDAQSLFSQIVANLDGEIALTIRDRKHNRLHWREPDREFALEVLDQDAEEPLHRSQQRSMNHNRSMRLTIFADEFQTKPLRQIEIELNRRQLPQSTDSV